MRIILFLIVSFFALNASATVLTYSSEGYRASIGDQRAVVFLNGKRYTCNWIDFQNEVVDDNGYVSTASTYNCGNNTLFVFKIFKGTKLSLQRLYDTKRSKVIFDKAADASEFATYRNEDN